MAIEPRVWVLASGMLKAREALNGVMLSDGSLSMVASDARFRIDLSGEEHLDWLLSIKASLQLLGARVSNGYPTMYRSKSKGKSYNRVVLMTTSHPFLTREFRRWYKDGRKIVPGDLHISPISLAHWFMGDGCSSFRHFAEAPRSVFISAVLATDAFVESEVDFLIARLRDLGITKARKAISHSKFEIYISEANSVIKFMSIVEPYILPSFRYKIKLPTLSQKSIRKEV